jgi:hypothetical protein
MLIGQNMTLRNRTEQVQFSIQEQLLRGNVERFRGGLVFKVHRLLCHSTPGPRVIKNNKKKKHRAGPQPCFLKPGTRNPKPGTRNPKPGTRNPKPGTRNPEPGTRNTNPEVRNPNPEI